MCHIKKTEGVLYNFHSIFLFLALKMTAILIINETYTDVEGRFIRN